MAARAATGEEVAIVQVPLTVHIFHYLVRNPTMDMVMATVTATQVSAIKASQIKVQAMDKPFRTSETSTASSEEVEAAAAGVEAAEVAAAAVILVMVEVVGEATAKASFSSMTRKRKRKKRRKKA